MHALVNLLFPVSILAAIILFFVAVGLLFRKSTRQSKKYSNRAIVLGIVCFSYVALVLIFSYSRKKKFDSIMPQLLTGNYQYLDTLVDRDVDTSLYLPTLNLSPDGKFTFHPTPDPDSLLKGKWNIKTYERFVNFNDEKGNLIWKPEWDTTGGDVDLIFKENGNRVVYRIMK